MTVRPSKSCQDFAEDEEIYVEPDQNLHQSIDAVVPTTAHTLPKKDKPAQPRPPVAQKPEVRALRNGGVARQQISSCAGDMGSSLMNLYLEIISLNSSGTS